MCLISSSKSIWAWAEEVSFVVALWIASLNDLEWVGRDGLLVLLWFSTKVEILKLYHYLTNVKQRIFGIKNCTTIQLLLDSCW